MAGRSRRARAEDPDDLFAVTGRPQVRMMLGREPWPAPEQFPVNVLPSSVGRLVLKDLQASAAPLIVTGFASIAKLIEFISTRAPDPRSGSRILLGTEPFATARTSFASTTAPFEEEVRRFWIEDEGVSLLLSALLDGALSAWNFSTFHPGSSVKRNSLLELMRTSRDAWPFKTIERSSTMLPPWLFQHRSPLFG